MKKIISFLLSVIVVFSCVQTAWAEREDSADIQSVISDIIEWKSEALGGDKTLCDSYIAEHAGENVCDWLAFSSGRMGERSAGEYSAAVQAIFNEKGEELTVPDVQRLFLASAACGVEEYQSDMMSAVISDFSRDELPDKLINHLVFLLHVIDSGFYSLPDNTYTREDIILEILSRRHESGALYMLNENTPETDMTAMAVCALAPYVNGDPEIRSAVEDMISYLSTQQTENGTVKNWGKPSCETTAQTIVALCTMGIDPMTDKRFINNNNDLLDGLFSYRQPDGGFAHNDESSGSDAYATAQALYALVSYERFVQGKRVLFDFRSEQDDFLRSDIKRLNDEINSLETNDTAKAEALLAEVNEIPVTERMYIVSFVKLSDVLSENGLDNTALYSPSELSTDEGVGEPEALFPLLYESGQTLTNMSDAVSVLTIDEPPHADNGASDKIPKTAEVLFLLAIGFGAATAIVINHAVFRKKDPRRK